MGLSIRSYCQMNDIAQLHAQSSETPEAPKILNGLPVSEIRAELDRILKSRVFVHSHRIRRFLQFVVEECLLGRQHRLKEYLIGLEVFNRQDDFDPRVDSIVRVEARRLRMKIEEYYQREGIQNEICIELRKGSYVPIFAHRRPGSQDGYGPHPLLARKHSIAIGPWTGANGATDIIPDITRKLVHELVRGGKFQVLADGDGHHGGVDGASDGSPRADYLLEGRVEGSEQDLQVLLRLKNVDGSAYVWSDSGHVDGIEHLASSLNRTIMTSSPRPESARIRPRSEGAASYEHYIRGKYQCKTGTPESIKGCVAHFEKAIEIDPEYAAAWASLAECWMVTSLFGLSGPREAGAKMKEAAQKAVDIEPGLPEAQVAQGMVESVVEWNWTGAERSFQRAIQIDPRDPIAHLAYAIHLASRGLMKAALVETECALEIDPAARATNFILGWLYGVSGRHDEAIAQHTLVSRLSPDYPLSYLGLGWAHLGKGQLSDALAQFTNAANLLKCRSLIAGCLGHCYGRLHQRDEALRQLAAINAQPQSQYASPVSVAAVYSGLGQTDRALSALEQAAESRDCALPVQLLNPEFDALRGEKRFTGILDKMGFRRTTTARVPDSDYQASSSPASV